MSSRAEGSGAHSGRAPVVFIGGFGRSGSTLLESLLATMDGVVALGETEHLWERGVLGDEVCACGSVFSLCPFWTEVGARAFGGWDAVDVDRVLQLKRAVVRQRWLTRTMRRRPPAGVLRELVEYAALHERIYSAARELTSARVLVDSSKFPPMAMALAHHPAVDLRVIHLVRDPRGVAYSWSKTVTRPETHEQADMPRYRPSYSALQWDAANLAIRGVNRLGRPVVTVHYERLVDDPSAQIGEAWQRLDLPGTGAVPLIGPREFDLVKTHSVAGNPMRFRRGPTTLRPDNDWSTQMAARDRAVVTALTMPVLRALGYPVRHSRTPATQDAEQ